MTINLPNVKPMQEIDTLYRKVLRDYRIPHTLMVQVVLDGFVHKSIRCEGVLHPITPEGLWEYITKGLNDGLNEHLTIRRLQLKMTDPYKRLFALPAVALYCQRLYPVLQPLLTKLYSEQLNIYQDRLFITLVGDEVLSAEVIPYGRKN